MPSPRVFAFLVGALLLVGPIAGQEPGKKKDDPKETKKDDKEAPAKFKGQLPANWKKLGLTDEQSQKVYKLQAKYGEQIDKLEEQIKELKAKMTKERFEILTADQKKRLEELNKAKAGG